MNLAPHAAIVRGDDLHYSWGWLQAVLALNSTDIASIHVEDPDSGAYDDVVIRRHTGRDEHFQVKNSNTSGTSIDETWLLTATTGKGRAPLRHYYDTWADLGGPAINADLVLVTTRTVDPNDPILKLRDINTGRLPADTIRAATPRSALGKARARWATGLSVSEEELYAFLPHLIIRVEGSEAQVRDQCRPLMRLAGLRHDDHAITLGVDLVREWVKQGVRGRTLEELRADVAGAGLLAQSGLLVLSVHAIDRPSDALAPTRRLDWVDAYAGDEPGSRRVLRPGMSWQPLHEELQSVERELKGFGVRNLRLTGAMRLSTFFTVGTVFSGVRSWQVSYDERGDLWSSTDADQAPEPAAVLIGDPADLEPASDLGVALSLTLDCSLDVARFLEVDDLAWSMINIGCADKPGRHALQSGSHAVAWAREARELIRAAARTTGADRVHLFFAAPAGAAFLLGHDWNLLPETVVYEHTGSSYAPTFLVRSMVGQPTAE